MAELTTETLIKIIIGILVFVAVIAGVYLAFRNNIFDFFKNLGGSEAQAGQAILILIK